MYRLKTIQMVAIIYIVHACCIHCEVETTSNLYLKRFYWLYTLRFKLTWAFVMAHCLSSMRASVPQQFYLNIFSFKTTHRILTKLYKNDPRVVPYQTCLNRSSRFPECNLNNHENYKSQSFHICYIASSRGPLPKLFKLCPWGQIMLQGVKIDPAPGIVILHWFI